MPTCSNEKAVSARSAFVRSTGLGLSAKGRKALRTGNSKIGLTASAGRRVAEWWTLFAALADAREALAMWKDDYNRASQYPPVYLADELITAQNIVCYPDANMRLAISRAIATETPRGWRITKQT